MSDWTSSFVRRRIVSAVSCGHLLDGRVRRDAARVDEGEDVDEVVGAVLDRRAGEGPTAAAADRTDDLGRLRVPVLDPLGLVEDDDVELDVRVGEEVRVAASAFRS